MIYHFPGNFFLPMPIIQSEKHVSSGELTVCVTQETRNPLNFVHMFPELCADLAEELKLGQFFYQ